MQILEAGPLGLRSAVHWLAHPDGGAEIVVFPMVHVGSQHFYDRVCQLLAQSDLILLEGVSHGAARRLGSLYDRFAIQPALQLKSQRVMRPWLQSRKEKVVQFDVDSAEFDVQWRQVPLWKRFAFRSMAELAFRLNATRPGLARLMAMEDRLSTTEVINSDRMSDVDALILKRRDSAMIEVLRTVLASPETHWKSVSIVVGAAHTRAVFSFLINEKRYYTVRTEWLTVFGPEPGLD